MTRPPTTVSLVLGGGGARGLAHVGVIEHLEALGYEVRSIAGCSIGALVGGVYAAGKLADFTKWVRALGRVDVLRLLDLSWNSTGLFKGERVIEVIRSLVGEWDIEDLPVPFTAVATDLSTGREVWLDQGPLFDAIRASVAIPTVFMPFQSGHRQLVDGALVNPVPMAPTLRDTTDITVAVNVSARAREPWPGPADEPDPDTETARAASGDSGTYRSRIAQFVRELSGADEEPADGEDGGDLSLFEVLSLSMDTMQNIIARHQLAAYSPDALIEIPRDVSMVHEFHRAAELIQLGREAAERAFRDAGRRSATP